MATTRTSIIAIDVCMMSREHQQKEILVVDDHPEIATMIADALGEEGYQTRIVHDGAAALRVAREQRPDLILMDVAMPTLRGDQAIRRMRAQGLADIPVILMTADPQPERFGGLGAQQIIRKPFDLTRLLDMIAQSID